MTGDGAVLSAPSNPSRKIFPLLSQIFAYDESRLFDRFIFLPMSCWSASRALFVIFPSSHLISRPFKRGSKPSSLRFTYVPKNPHDFLSLPCQLKNGSNCTETLRIPTKIHNSPLFNLIRCHSFYGHCHDRH